MVVFGRPKGRRGSYKQWQEDNIAPQVVFEILSPSNSLEEMERKLLFYQRYGVEEYYLYDPDSHNFKGWLRQEGLLSSIPEIKGWVSPRLSIRFDLREDGLEIYSLDGQKFLSFLITNCRNQNRKVATSAKFAPLTAVKCDNPTRRICWVNS